MRKLFTLMAAGTIGCAGGAASAQLIQDRGFLYGSSGGGFQPFSVDEPGTPVTPGMGVSVSLGYLDGTSSVGRVGGKQKSWVPANFRVSGVGASDPTLGSFSPIVPQGLPGAGLSFGRRVDLASSRDLSADPLVGFHGVVVGAGPGEPGYMQSFAYNPAGGFSPSSEPYAPFGADFTDGIRVATGDVDGDGTNEVVASKNGCYVGHVTLIKREIGPPRKVVTIDPFSAMPMLQGEIALDVADLNGDGRAEVAALGPNASGGQTLKFFSYSDSSGPSLDEVLSFSWGASNPQATRSGGGGPSGGGGHVTLIKREIAPPVLVVSSNDGTGPIISAFDVFVNPATGGFSLGTEQPLDLSTLRAASPDLNASWSNLAFSVSGLEAPTSFGRAGSNGYVLSLGPILVPEPSALAGLAGAAVLGQRRRRA